MAISKHTPLHRLITFSNENVSFKSAIKHRETPQTAVKSQFKASLTDVTA